MLEVAGIKPTSYYQPPVQMADSLLLLGFLN